jgi:hypothetical protein
VLATFPNLDLILFKQVSVSLRGHFSHAAYMAKGLRAHQVLCCASSHKGAMEPLNALTVIFFALQDIDTKILSTSISLVEVMTTNMIRATAQLLSTITGQNLQGLVVGLLPIT